MANAVQHPGRPGGVALVLRGKMGIGKGEFFAVLLAEVLAQRLEQGGRVNQLHLVTPVAWLAIRQHPNTGCDAGVVEQVERQGDDGF